MYFLQMAYARPPIIEAVIDIQVKLGSLPEKASFDRIVATLQPAFPVEVNANQVTFNLSVDPATGQPSTTTRHLGTGKRLTSAANDRVLLVQPRGMSLSHLAPYSEWSKFRREGVSAWRAYSEAVMPLAVTRLALRYVNRIYLPERQTFQLQNYFKLYPETPDDQAIGQLFIQVQLPQVDMGSGVLAIVNLASAGSRVEDGSYGFMLDIDLSATQELPADAETIFSRLDALRDRKNALFESFITDKTRELFK